MLYLGSPYSHPKSVIREVRYLAVMQACAYFQKQGVCVYSPIMHWHQCSIMHKLPTDIDTWRVQCIGMLKRATEFGMLLLPEWEQSKGLREEWFKSLELDLPINGYELSDRDVVCMGASALIVWPTSTP